MVSFRYLLLIYYNPLAKLNNTVIMPKIITSNVFPKSLIMAAITTPANIN